MADLPEFIASAVILHDQRFMTMTKPIDTEPNNGGDEAPIIQPVTDAFIESMRGSLAGIMPSDIERDPDREFFP